MTDDELKKLYEKIYFVEIDARDKIHSRLQLSLTLLLAVGGAVVFLLQNVDYQTGAWTALRAMFVLFFCGGVVVLVVAAGFFVKAFHNSRYRFLPDSRQTADYRAQLEATYAQYEQSRQLVLDALDTYIITYYIDCGAFNTRVNDRRAAYLHSCNGAIIVAAVALMIAYLAFHFGGLARVK
jgi:hypothetical protein